MSRLARLGAGPAGLPATEAASGAAVVGVAVEVGGAAGRRGGLATASRRFLSVTERRAPLKTCAWSLVTASSAWAGLEKRTWAVESGDVSVTAQYHI